MIGIALYVDKLSVVTIRAIDPSDSEAQLYRYNQSGSRRASGVHELVRGIYQVISNSAMEVSAPGVGLSILRGKDDPTDLAASILALEPGSTVESVKAFFAAPKEF